YREADMKFVGQIFEVTTRLPEEPFREGDKERLRRRFVADYEAEFGTGTAWTEAEVLLVNSRVRAVGRTETQTVTETFGQERHTATEREVIEPLSGHRRRVEVHRGFGALGKAEGPCLIEEPDTTVYVPPDATVEVIDGGHFLIRLNHADASA
ncbi:hypothetical protein, partial [Acrocarpospora sp. B8E8]|uniref:hypothetical protein n=1 Tax=Acrocarpospora sp. B8E8 TaxID=3153572 RepID=UPI00325EC03D